MTILDYIKEAQTGKYKGLTLGLHKLNKAIYGVRQRFIYTIAGKPKTGKTSIVDDQFVISLYLNNKDLFEQGLVEIHYYSYEISKLIKQAKYITWYIRNVCKRRTIEFKNKEYIISAPLILGWMHDDEGEIIKVDSIQDCVNEAYHELIDPLFSYIKFHTERENPTGLYKQWLKIAQENGEFEYTEWEDITGKKQKKISGYKPKNSRKLILVIIDHARKVPVERGYTLKQNLDKLLEYQVIFRDMFNFSFVNIVHLNDEDVAAVKLAGENYVPAYENIKDSRNFIEDSDVVLVVFDPTYPRYGLRKHFGIDIKNVKQLLLNFGKEYKYRVIALVANRYGNLGVIRTVFDGAAGSFTQYENFIENDISSLIN